MAHMLVGISDQKRKKTHVSDGDKLMEKNKEGTGRPGWQTEEGSRTWCPRTGRALPLPPVRQEVA